MKTWPLQNIKNSDELMKFLIHGMEIGMGFLCSIIFTINTQNTFNTDVVDVALLNESL